MVTRLNITHLPMPPARYRVDRQADFESEARARSEDFDRCNRLFRAALIAERQENYEAANRVSAKLDYGQGEPPHTVASSLYMRNQCIRIAGAFWQLVDENPDLEVLPFTLLPAQLEFPGQMIGDVDPARLSRSLRDSLKRKGAGKTEGFLFAELDGEYEIGSDTWRLHFHGIASNGMIDVVERLRSLRNYRSLRSDTDVTRSVQRVRINRSLTNLPAPLTYLIKRYWSARWEGVLGDRAVRQSYPSRIPEPRHSQLLLSFDRWNLQNMCLLMGLEVGSDGLRLRSNVHE